MCEAFYEAIVHSLLPVIYLIALETDHFRHLYNLEKKQFVIGHFVVILVLVWIIKTGYFLGSLGLACIRKIFADIRKRITAFVDPSATFENDQPLRGPSPVDMWSDSNPPPASVTPHGWEAVRDGLHRKGKSLGGPKGSVGNLVFRASLALNLMQHRCKSDLFVVGGQGRLFVERALGAFIPAAALSTAAASKKDSIAELIKLMEDEHHASKEVVVATCVACHKLRVYGNRTDHDHLDDLTPGEKPDVIKNVFIVAKALLNKVTAT